MIWDENVDVTVSNLSSFVKYHYTFIMDVVSFLSEKQREFHKNAKNVKKFKKLLKQQNQQNDPSLSQRLLIEV